MLTHFTLIDKKNKKKNSKIDNPYWIAYLNKNTSIWAIQGLVRLQEQIPK